MFKYFFVLLSLCAFGGYAAEYQAEIKGGYFIPSGPLFQRIYGGGGIYSLELTRSFTCRTDLFVSAGYFSKDGRSIGENDSTTVRIVPLALGFKYNWCLCRCIRGYAGLGLEAVYLNTRDRSPFVIQSVSKWWPGVIGKAGVFVPLCGRFSLDVFADYSYCEIPFYNTAGGTVARHSADISGFTVGLGLNYRFCGCRR